MPGYANCVVGADDTFDLDDDGVVVVLRLEIPDAGSGPGRCGGAVVPSVGAYGQQRMTLGTVIVGASIGGVRTAQALRSVGYEGEITFVGDEWALPYDRPPLSKGLLAGTATPESLTLLSEQEAANLGVRLMLGRAARHLDVAGASWSWRTGSGWLMTTWWSPPAPGRGSRRGASPRACTTCGRWQTPRGCGRT